MLAEKPHPEMGYRSCLGLMNRAHRHTPERLEAAAARALHFGACSLASVDSILRHHLDRAPLDEPAPPPPILSHANLRGAAYFQ
jgi:hypothetical protein